MIKEKFLNKDEIIEQSVLDYKLCFCAENKIFQPLAKKLTKKQTNLKFTLKVPFSSPSHSFPRPPSPPQPFALTLVPRLRWSYEGSRISLKVIPL